MKRLLPFNYFELRDLCDYLKRTGDYEVLSNSKSQFIPSMPEHFPYFEKHAKVLNSTKESVNGNSISHLIDWIQKNQILVSAILLSVAIISSMVIYAFATRYYVVPKNHINIDRWTGRVQEWER